MGFGILAHHFLSLPIVVTGILQSGLYQNSTLGAILLTRSPDMQPKYDLTNIKLNNIILDIHISNYWRMVCYKLNYLEMRSEVDQNKRQEKLEWLHLVDSLKESHRSDVDKVVIAFRHVTDEHIKHSKLDLELARALKDGEAVIREQIKQETIKYTQKVLEDCYRIFVGRSFQDG
jgi:hypothetical protein